MSYGKWNYPVGLLLSVLVARGGAAGADEGVVAYPDALDAAAVSVEQLGSILDEALILGNGDLTGLVHMEGVATANQAHQERRLGRPDEPLDLGSLILGTPGN